MNEWTQQEFRISPPESQDLLGTDREDYEDERRRIAWAVFYLLLAGLAVSGLKVLATILV